MLVCTFLIATLLTTPTDVVRAVYEAESDGDWQRAMSYFSAESDAAFRREIRNDIRMRCIEIESIRVREIETRDQTSDQTATVAATVHAVRTPRYGGAIRDEVEERTFTMKKENGAWHIAAMPQPEDALAERILATKSDDEIAPLLAGNSRLIGPPLVRRLLAKAAAQARAGDGRYPRRSAAIIRDIAAAIDDKSGLSIALAAETGAMREPGASTALILSLARKAMRIAEESDDPSAFGFCVMALSAAQAGADEPALEIERTLHHALEKRQSLSWSHISGIEAALGVTLFGRGDYAGAYQAFAEGLPLDIAEDSENESGFKEVHLGRIMAAQNDPQLALTYFRRGVERKTQKRFVIMGWVGIAQALRALGRLGEAKEAAEKALAIGRPTPFKGMIATAYTALTEIEIDRGDSAHAEETLRQAIAYGREANYTTAEMDALITLGNLYFRQQRFADARRTAEEAVALSGRIDDVQFDRYAALMLAARVEQALGNADSAIAAYRNAIDEIETARGVVAGSDRQQRSFFEPFQAAYAELAGLLFARGATEEGLLFAERGKSRVLLDTFARERRRAEDALSPEQRRTLTSAVHALGEANKRIVALRASSSAASSELAAATSQQRRAQLALEQLDAAIAVSDPALRTVNTRGVIDPATLRTIVTRPDFAILEYVVREHGVDLAVVRQRNGRVVLSHHRIAADAATLAKRIDAYAAQLSGRGLRHRAEGRALYDLLLAPAAKELAGKRVLGIVPDGVLWRLPFEALVGANGRFVVEDVSTFYMPSISVYRDMLRRAPHRAHARTLVAFGDPAIAGARESIGAVYRGVRLEPLPDAKEEVRDIARVWGPRSAVYTGAQAREAVAKREMTRSRIVHFAAHGLFDDANPMFSQIVLATERDSEEDGTLQAWEMMRLDLDADLVVLSACETARGHIGAGEGLIGMSWALFASGCPSTVAAQWNVSSRSTAGLMVAFHRQLAHRNGGPFGKAEALRAAQLSLLRDPRTAHPFHWASFVLIGSADWR